MGKGKNPFPRISINLERIIMADYDNAKYEKKPSGTIIIDNVEVAHTMQCCHCGKHFVSIKGSGKVRGFCMCCHKITCGARACDPCIPFEKKIEQIEKDGVLSRIPL